MTKAKLTLTVEIDLDEAKKFALAEKLGLKFGTIEELKEELIKIGKEWAEDFDDFKGCAAAAFEVTETRVKGPGIFDLEPGERFKFSGGAETYKVKAFIRKRLPRLGVVPVCEATRESDKGRQLFTHNLEIEKLEVTP